MPVTSQVFQQHQQRWHRSLRLQTRRKEPFNRATTFVCYLEDPQEWIIERVGADGAFNANLTE